MMENFVRKRGNKEDILVVSESTDEGLWNEKMHGRRRDTVEGAVLVRSGGRGDVVRGS